MRSLLVNPDDRIEVEIFIGQDDKGRLYVAKSEENLKLITEKIKKLETEKQTFKFRRPTSKDVVDLSQKVTISADSILNESPNLSVDPSFSAYKRILSLLVEWSLKDEEGKIIPVSKDAINSLDPLVFKILDQMLDEETSGSLQF